MSCSDCDTHSNKIFYSSSILCCKEEIHPGADFAFCWSNDFRHSSHKEKSPFVGNHLTPQWCVTIGSDIWCWMNAGFIFGNSIRMARTNRGFPVQPELHGVFLRLILMLGWKVNQILIRLPQSFYSYLYLTVTADISCHALGNILVILLLLLEQDGLLGNYHNFCLFIVVIQWE